MPLVNAPAKRRSISSRWWWEVGGERRKAWEFLLRLMYSGREFALYEPVRSAGLSRRSRASVCPPGRSRAALRLR